MKTIFPLTKALALGLSKRLLTSPSFKSVKAFLHYASSIHCAFFSLGAWQHAIPRLLLVLQASSRFFVTWSFHSHPTLRRFQRKKRSLKSNAIAFPLELMVLARGSHRVRFDRLTGLFSTPFAWKNFFFHVPRRNPRLEMLTLVVVVANIINIYRPSMLIVYSN